MTRRASARSAADPDRGLIKGLKSDFASLADPDRAAAQQAYMKSSMPYYGIATPDMRRLCRARFRAHPLPRRAVWRATWLDLWHNARHREERYAALELAGHAPYRNYLDAQLLPSLEVLIVSGAWWDFVDHIAGSLIGQVLAKDPAATTPVLRRWAHSDDIWLRRSAILAQLKFKHETDPELLFELIEPSLAAREFFLRKAIGWALREYSKTDPQAVVAYAAANRERLSGLSLREGLKVLKKQGVSGLPL